MSNFAFLTQEPKFQAFASACVEAEKTLAISPILCALSTRRALELAVKWFYAVDPKLNRPLNDNLSPLIWEPTFQAVVNDRAPGLVDKLRYIVKLGNLAAHSNRAISRDEALASLSHLFAFVFQLDYRYGEKFKSRKFDPTAVGASSTGTTSTVPSKLFFAAKKALDDATADNKKKSAELERFREKYVAELDQKNETIAKKEAELLELLNALGQKEATVDALQKELEAFKTQREQELAFVVAPDPNEAETRRRYIDVELKLSGWVFPDEKAETGLEPNVRLEYEIDGLPTPSGKGRADYVLLGSNGKPLAVVEAKRTTVDENAGREQAKLYADALEKRFGVRPLIFYSNGFKTWLWDDSNSPPRRVGGFYSPKDLEKVVERRGVVKSIVETEVRPSFGLRPYQKGAVRAVCEAFESGKRRALVAMATGTGKTRTVAALVDALTRANRVQRTLFLADRRELVSQAKESFAATRCDLSLCNFLDNKADAATARVLFSTYPTLLNALDSARNDGDAATCALTPGAFDLIVVDEAHRSVYRKYRAIFEYFDALVVGLTATPKDEVDRNTFEFFDVKHETPTFAYSFEEAVKAGFLVPYRNVEIATEILENGVEYDKLTDEEKERYEELFGSGESSEEFEEDDENDATSTQKKPTKSASTPDKIEAEKINNYVFNASTVDLMLQELMQNGVKTQGGDRLGKTIIFTPNKRCAAFVVKRFDALYPQYRGEFARRIVCGEAGVDELLKNFKREDRAPFIATTVDMLETGVDVPECVNLVFFKRIRSKVKFWQALGRGTRRCDKLELIDGCDGAYVGKRRFYVFDYMQNFEFFRQNKDGVKSSVVKSLTETVFERRVRLIFALQRPELAADAEIAAWRSELVAETVGQIADLNSTQTAVAQRLEYVEKFRDAKSFESLSESARDALTKEVAPLVFSTDVDERAKRFDALVYAAVLATLEGKSVAAPRRRLTETCEALEGKTTIPQVAAKIETIKFAKSDELWNGGDPTAFERVRRELRALCQFLENDGASALYVECDFDDVASIRTEDAAFDVKSFDKTAYRREVERYVTEHKNDEPIYRLRNNLPLTKYHWEELERVFEDELGAGATSEQLNEAREGVKLGIFIRKIAKMERDAVERAFAEFFDWNRLNVEQFEFLQRVVNYVVENGFAARQDLVKAPFDPAEIHRIFNSVEKGKICNALELMRENAGGAA